MQVTYAVAVGDAMKEEMRKDESIVLYGEDVAEFGNIFGVTRGMLEEFGPKRVRNTPISETAIISSAIGAAVTGLRPVVEIMYADFTLVAFHEIFHMLGKWRYMHGEEYKLPIVVRSAMGASRGAGAEHSNTFQTLFMHAPGLTIISPSNAYDAKGLLKAAIQSDNPVLFFEHKQLYQKKGEVPEEEYIIPIGVADVKREGTDVTIIAISNMVENALEAADILAKEGISAEVVDPRTLAPLDTDTIYNSIRKTHRVVIAESGYRSGGIGAEMAAKIQEDMYDELDGPVMRVAGLDVPVPYNLELEAAALPTTEEIVSAAKSIF